MIFSAGAVVAIGFFLALLWCGAVEIPSADIIAALGGRPTSSPYLRTIILESRLPMAVAATCCGAVLSVAGLMMQTLFQNPLAGPSVLGISSGASLGVALLMLSAASIGGAVESTWFPALTVTGALAGSAFTILALFVFSSVFKSGMSLLIVGLMISYLCSSLISLLNYFSPSEEIRNYLVWGLGSFSGLRLGSAFWLLGLSVVSLIPVIFCVKPLNAALLGEGYLESMGYSARCFRGTVLFLTGLLVAVATAFCGPIGFIGLIVPHLCRLLLQTSNHHLLLPGCVVFGAAVSLGCALACVLPSASLGVLPINVITPVVGVPVILYLLVNRRRLPYFS